MIFLNDDGLVLLLFDNPPCKTDIPFYQIICSTTNKKCLFQPAYLDQQVGLWDVCPKNKELRSPLFPLL